MSTLVPIAEAATFHGGATFSRRGWEHAGRWLLDARVPSGPRHYDLARLRPKTLPAGAGRQHPVADAGVSSHDQKSDPERHGPDAKDVRFRQWLDVRNHFGPRVGDEFPPTGSSESPGTVAGDVDHRVLAHKDRLLRFDTELGFAIGEMKNIEVVIINQGEAPTFEAERAQDVLEIIIFFLARLYRSRSPKNKKMLGKRKGAGEA